MIYTLLMADYPVLDFIRDKQIIAITKIYDEKRIPLNIQSGLTPENLAKWLSKRMIPKNRPEIKNLLRISNTKYLQELYYDSHAASLSDQYWVRRESECLDWKDVNFFTNDYSYDVGNVLMRGHIPNHDFCINSPDLATNGIVPKAWRKKNGQNYLIKGNSDSHCQQGINEAIIYRFLRDNPIEHLECAEYSMTNINGKICSVSKNFLDSDTELVPAAYIYYSEKPQKIPYWHMMSMCEKYHIPEAKEFIDSMLMLDYLICNRDRHLGNFGFLRNIHTLEFIGPAPLYDNGSSLWFDEDLINGKEGLFDSMGKPFSNYFAGQLKETDWKKNIEAFNIDALTCYIEQVMDNVNFNGKKSSGIIERIWHRSSGLGKAIKKFKEQTKDEIER